MKHLIIKVAIVAAVLLSVSICELQAQDVYRCSGITAKGKPCMNIVPKAGDYCRLHGPNVIHCAGITSKGKPCHMIVAKAGDYCRWHKK